MVDINLVVEAGRLAERRGWSSVEVVEPDALGSVLPGPGEMIVVAPAGTFSSPHARDVAALSASGKSVAVVTADVLAEDVQAWLPHGSVHVAGSRRDVGGWWARAGLAALSWYGEDGIDECLVNGVLPSPPTGEDARTAIATIVASGKAAGTLTSDPVLAQRYLDLGCTFVAVGVDVLMFANAARKLRGQFAGAQAAAAPAKPSAGY